MNQKLLNITFQKKYLPIALLFALFVIIYNFFVNFYGMGNEVSNWRYYIFAGITFLTFLIFLLKYRNKNSRIEGKEIIYLIITSLLFLVVSYYKCQKAHVNMPIRVFVQISLFLLPALYAFTLKNIFSFKSLFKLMKVLTIITICFYFLEPKHTIMSFLDINNYLKIDLLHSRTFTESHNYFDSFLQLFLFFNYFETKVKDTMVKKSLNRFMKITLFFTLISFKRFGVLFALFIFFTRKIINYDKKINVSVIVPTLLFVISTVLYTSVLQGKIFNFTYDQLFSFTSGRNWFLSLWEYYNYVSYGYGSSLLIIGRYLEMDLTQIYLELNIICLFLFIFSFFKLSKNNNYSLLIICYVLINMLTSSSLPWSIGWIVMFLNIFCINSEKVKDEIATMNGGSL